MTCADGYLPLTNCWQGWCGDVRDNFDCNADYAIMGSNAEAARLLLGGHPMPEGFLSFDLFFDTPTVPTGGGIHILSLTSDHIALGSVRGNPHYPSWLRADFEVETSTGVPCLQIGIYNADPEGAPWKDDIVVHEVFTGIPLVAQEWMPFTIRWLKTGDRLYMSVNEGLEGTYFDAGVHPLSRHFHALSVGNVDNIGDGSVRFRRFRWGPLIGAVPV